MKDSMKLFVHHYKSDHNSDSILFNLIKRERNSLGRIFIESYFITRPSTVSLRPGSHNRTFLADILLPECGILYKIVKKKKNYIF